MKLTNLWIVGLRNPHHNSAEQYAFVNQDEALIFMTQLEVEGWQTAMAFESHVVFADTQTVIGPEVAK